MYKLLLCLRYLTTRYIALVSIVSVMLGVATMIVVNSVMGGFREKMRDRLHGILADIVVESTTLDGFPNPELVMQRIQELAGDKIEAMTPAIEMFAMLTYKNQGQGPQFTRPIRILGIDPKGRSRVGEFRMHLVNAENRADPSFELRADAEKWRRENADLLQKDGSDYIPAGAIVGHQIATARGKGMHSDQQIIGPGQEIIITTVTAGKPQPVSDRLIVVDTYKSEMAEYDSTYVFMPLDRLQQIRRMGSKVTMIQLRLKHYADAAKVVAALQADFPRVYYDVQTWEDKQGPLLQAVQVEAFILNIILFFIIAVAGFGILAIFFMIVVEKTRDIGILKALGAADWGVMGVFLAFGLALGIVGCGLGSAFGISFTLNINPIEGLLTRWTGIEAFPRDVYYFKEIPVQLDPLTIVMVNVGALVIAVLAAVLPALRAARLRPVEALRYE